MDIENDKSKFTLEELSEKVKLLENRLSELELQISLQKTAIEQIPGQNIKKQRIISLKEDDSIVIDDEAIESSVVEYGFSWFGSIVLIVGLSFFMNYLRHSFNGLISALLGGVAIAGVYILANYLKKTFSYLSFMLVISSHILLYYLVLHLYFFSSTPLISVKGIVVLLLIGVAAFNIYQSIQRKSEFMAVFGIIFIFITSVFSDQTHLSLSIASISSILSLFLFVKKKWSVQFIFNLFLVYIALIIWLFGNPIMGHPFQVRANHDFGLIYLFLTGFIFSSITLLPKKETYKINIFTSGVVLNTMAFSLLVLLMVAAFLPTNYSILFLIVFVMCLGFSVVLKLRNDSQFIQSFYACCGFMALSIAVYGYTKFPDSYFWLAIQSLLVVSIALWYRSRIIVIMNTILFVAILIAYLTTSISIDKINFTFAIVALISARIINWKKARLALETEFIRNTYLISLFVMVLFGLYKAIPKEYVPISWTLAALSYFIFSVILKNVKYRYLSIFTLVCAGIYLFIVDASKMTIGFRVGTFLLIAAIAFGIAIYYMKKIKKNTDDKIEENNLKQTPEN